jgi:hypothetical protein
VRATAIDCRASASGRAVGQEATRREAAVGGHEAGGCSGMRVGAGAAPAGGRSRGGVVGGRSRGGAVGGKARLTDS